VSIPYFIMEFDFPSTNGNVLCPATLLCITYSFPFSTLKGSVKSKSFCRSLNKLLLAFGFI
jgi:hypothetical protein